MNRIYSDTRRDGKAIDPDFALSQEWPGELFIQNLDLYHGRNYDQPRGILGVPLFSYLYHEYIICYGGDWGSFLGDNTSGIHYHASNFVLGNLPAGCPQSMKRMTRNISVEEADDKILQMAQNACAMFKQARQYLVFGEMLASGPLDVQDVPVRFYGLTFSEWKKRTVSMPAVLHCPWKSPEGIVAYALANISDVVQRFRMDLPAYVLSGSVNLVLHRNGDEPVVLKTNVSLPGSVELVLYPLDAAILKILL